MTKWMISLNRVKYFMASYNKRFDQWPLAHCCICNQGCPISPAPVSSSNEEQMDEKANSWSIGLPVNCLHDPEIERELNT